MLSKLKITNIALISESELEFNDGLNILSGETGAGKSLIIDSLNFVLGARADKTLIKNGQEYAKVEAVFLLDEINNDIKSFFSMINTDPEDTILVTRYLTVKGRNEVRVNGEIVTNSMLKKLTGLLVDVHGQHSHQALLDSKNHIDILDNFNTVNIDPLKNKLVNSIVILKEINDKIDAIGGVGENRDHNIELLKHQINEIETANLKNDEIKELQDKKLYMLNSEKIYTSLNTTNEVLQSGEYNALNFIKVAINNLTNVSSFDTDIQSKLENVQNIYYDLLDIAENLADKMNDINYSVSDLNEIEERLDLIKGLQRKYGSTFEQIFAYLYNAKDKLEMLENADFELEKLLSYKQQTLNDIYDTCIKLTQTRKETAKVIEQQIVKELAALGMKNANFMVNFSNNYKKEDIEQEYTRTGADKLEFMFSANLGEPLKPLNKIISGGEMSRFMLAIKTVLNDSSNKTLIFDEIDNGIGGVVGQIVGTKLKSLSSHNQIICVTHLAQIASFADVHIKIEKTEEDNHTRSSTTLLDNQGKVAEISRLLGADPQSSAGVMHAKEMLENAKDKS